jgi:hypothetical protein
MLDRRLDRGWVIEQHLQRAGDRADERSGQRRRTYLVELVRECPSQVPGDLALRVELDPQGASAQRWHGAQQAQPQLGGSARAVVVVVAELVQRVQQHLRWSVVRAT